MTDERIASHLDAIYDAAVGAAEIVAGQSRSEFLADRKSKLAGVMTLIIIGEAAVRISKRSQDYIDAHAEIPWEKIRAFRNRGAHGYDDLDFEIVWDALTTDVPVYCSRSQRCLASLAAPCRQITAARNRSRGTSRPRGPSAP